MMRSAAYSIGSLIDQQHAALLEQRLDFFGVVLDDAVGCGVAHPGLWRADGSPGGAFAEVPWVTAGAPLRARARSCGTLLRREFVVGKVTATNTVSTQKTSLNAIMSAWRCTIW